MAYGAEMKSKMRLMLEKEHKNILFIIEILLKEREKLEDGEKIDLDFFKKAVDFIRNYADRLHHEKEEDILFKELCRQENMHCNPVEQMLFEHNMGRNFVKEIEEGIKESRKDKIIKGVDGYASLIKEHIFKEDNILYPMSEDALAEKNKKGILEKFKEAEKLKEKDKTRCLAILNE